MNLINIKDDLFIKKCSTYVDGKLEIELRTKIFVEEQGFAISAEFDDEEKDSIGYLIYQNDQLIGVFSYIFRKPNEVFYRRLCLLKPYRRLGYGKLIFSYFENLFLSQVRPLRIYFHGEKYLKEYWIKLGYIILKEVSEGESSPPLLLVEKIIK